ncbi:uncharacterized protein LOC119107762 [Pollicipes pollicipes]|uniref:uncharacterized protein LOC119107762 n=1 Tax=Pollicipes pollicipes TaxID=41117 RepID=UPI001884B826|nr:uncharacterized protein LOC119107762 [Pollicipes pollicipes]
MPPLFIWLLLCGALRPAVAGDLLDVRSIGNNGIWLNVSINDNITLGEVIKEKTNARNMCVFAMRLNYTKETQAIKVKFTGNNGKPSPSTEAPLVISVRNWAGGHTFTVPYNVFGKDGRVMATEVQATRFLCPGDIGSEDHVVTSVGTNYLDPSKPAEGYMFNVEFKQVGHWTLDLAAPEQLEADPTEPAVFSFRWPPGAGLESVLISVRSVNAASLCVTVAVQPRACPLALTPSELTVDALYFTATASGALVVHRDQFPAGFYVIVLPRENDRLCDPAATPAATKTSRKKTVMVTVTAQHETPASYAAPAALALLLLLAGAVGTRLLRFDLYAPRLDIERQPSPEHRPERRDSLTASEDLLLNEAEEEPQPWAAAAAAAGLSAPSLLVGAALLLLALGGAAVLTALRSERDTGDLDLCYRNDLCHQPAGGVPGMNHLVARLPYVGAGLGLLVAVAAQKRVYRRVTADGTVRVGVEHDLGLLDSVGLALVLQGALSALHTTCPSGPAGHLDVVFIYFALVAMASKLFQTRRGRSATGHYAPLMLTAALVAAGLAKRLAGNAWYVWLVVAVVHVAVVAVIATHLYVLGDASVRFGSLKRLGEQSYLLAESPHFRMNRATFATALILNVALAVAGATARIDNFTHYVMLFFALHTGLYLAYYLLLKLVRAKEQGSRAALGLLALGTLLLLAAVIVLCGFSTFNTELPPAGSRLLNRACLGDSVFDVHDVWHMLAAAALFCLALGQLVLDDDLLLVPTMAIERF